MRVSDTAIFTLDVLAIFSVSLLLLFVYRRVVKGATIALRYQLFELRDQLASLVVSGKIGEADEDYLYLRDKINDTICVLDKLSFIVFARMMNAIASGAGPNAKTEKRIERLKGKPELALLYCNVWSVWVQAFYQNSLIVRILLSFASRFARHVYTRGKAGWLSSQILRSEESVARIETWKDELRRSAAAVC